MAAFNDLLKTFGMTFPSDNYSDTNIQELQFKLLKRLSGYGRKKAYEAYLKQNYILIGKVEALEDSDEANEEGNNLQDNDNDSTDSEHSDTHNKDDDSANFSYND
jgi:hypothetical protein